MIDCKTTTGLFSDYADGGLSPTEREMLEAHLKACADCTREFGYFTESLKALRDSQPLETTQVFLAKVRDAAAQHLHRRENLLRSEAVTVVTPKAGAPSRRVPAAAWLPYALAGAALLCVFGMGYLLAGSGRRELEDRLSRVESELRRERKRGGAAEPAGAPAPERKPADIMRFLTELDLVKVRDRYLSRELADALDSGKVIVDGKLTLMERGQATKAWAAEFGLVPEAERAAPAPPPAPKGPTEEEILAKHGLVLVDGKPLSRDAVAKFVEGYVQESPGTWRRPSDYVEQFVKDANLVEMDGRWMTAEQAAAVRERQFIKAPPAAPAFNDVTRAVDGLRIGVPMSYKELTLYPLVSAAPAAESAVLPLHAVLGNGEVELADPGRLFTAEVKNRRDADVLLLAGEILAGGRCARVVARDTIAPAGKTTRIPVLCVEPREWRAGASSFAEESGHFLSPPSLRRALLEDRGQGAVWSMIAGRAAGDTASQVARFRKNDTSDWVVRFSRLLAGQPGAVGVAVAIGDGVETVELFGSRALMVAYLDRIVAGTALEILERARERPPRKDPAFSNSVQGVKAFLQRIFQCTYETRSWGYGIRDGEAAVGQALVIGGAANHVLLFAPSRGTEPAAGEYALPRQKVARTLSELGARMDEATVAGRVELLADLESLRSPDVTRFLLKRLSTEKEEPVRLAAVRALGATADPKAAEALLTLAPRARAEPALFREVVRALARLGDDRTVDPMLQLVNSSPPEPSRAVLAALPDLLLKVRRRDVLEKAVARLVVLYEAAESAARGDVLIDPVVKDLQASEAAALHAAVRDAVTRVTGIEFTGAAACRKWWMDREAREGFLRGRGVK